MKNSIVAQPSKFIVTVCVLSLILFFSITAVAFSQQTVKNLKKVIIDTDMGWDDTLSLLYLMKNPSIEIIGVTVTGCGETYLENGINNALALLEMGNINAPVCKGTDKPLKFDHIFPKTFKEDMSNLMGLSITFPPVKTKISDKTAWDFIADTLNSSEEKITILSLGGFTNLAIMLQKRPDANLNKIEQIYAMGGAVYVDGNIALLNNAKKEWNQGKIYNTNYVAEWNIFVDPLSAKIVFNSAIPITLIPLDSCNYVMLQKDYINNITASDAIAVLVKNIFFKKTGSSDEGIPVPIFDPLATVIMAGAMKPNQILALNLDVNIVENISNNHCGQTYISNFSSNKLTSVVQGVSERTFKEEFARVINMAIK